MICGALNSLWKEYESICTVIDHSMDSVAEMSFEDAVFKLIGFDDKLQVYNQKNAVNPQLTFHAGLGYSKNRGRGAYRNRGGYRGRSNSYSTRGRGFQQQFSGANGRENSSSGSGSNTTPTC